MTSSTRRQGWMFAGLGLSVVAATAFAMVRHFGLSANLDPIDVVPKDSFLVATVDVEALRRSPISELLLGHGKGTRASKALGLGSLEQACGFDPLSRVKRLAVAAPEEGERGEFGVAARVEVSQHELETCTEALGKLRGERSESHHVGRFTVLEDAQKRSIGYGAEGLLVVGKGTWFAKMLAVAQRQAPGLDKSSGHEELRAALTKEDGWRTPSILVTALLPQSLRGRLKSDMAGEASHDPQVAIMNAVLGVSGLGLAVQAGDATKNVEVRLELVCDSPEACAEVEKLIQRKRLDASKDLALRMLGFGPLFDGLETKLEGSRLRASTAMNSAALAASLDRALRLQGTREHRELAPTAQPAPPAQPGSPGSLGELLRASDAGLPPADAAHP